MKHWTTISIDDTTSWPRGPGVYALFNMRRLVYIGSAQNLYRRLLEHGIHRVHHASWFPRQGCEPVPRAHLALRIAASRRMGDWLMREYRLVRRLKPCFNVRGV